MLPDKPRGPIDDDSPRDGGGGEAGLVPAGYALSRRKAALDAALAGVLLVLTAPLLLAAMLLVRLTSRGPVIYRQTRLGLGGRRFTIYKVRTMAHDCERLTGARWSTPGDPRITPAGRFLRRTHLDELPQLWNILRGEMSLVGPRPERPEIAAQLERAIPRYRLRVLVRPGLTGLAQIQLPADTDLAGVRRKLAHDLAYAERAGFWLDARLILGTSVRVLGLPSARAARLLGVPAVGAPPARDAAPVAEAAGPLVPAPAHAS